MSKENQETVDTKDQEIVISSEVTKSILDKYEVESITQEEFDEREQKSGEESTDDSNDESAVNEGQQENEESEVDVDITDDDLKILSDAGITEESLSGKTLAEIKQIVVDNTPQVETPVETQESIIISDALAESLSAQYPFAKNLKGKTIEEVMQIVQNQNSYITQLEQQKKNTGAEEQNTNSQQISNSDSDQQLSEDEVVDILNLSPAEATKRINAMVKSEATKIAGAVVDEKLKQFMPAVNQVTIAEEKKQFLGELSKALPKDADPEEAWNGWLEANKGKLSEEDKQTLVKNPSILIRLISKEYVPEVTSTETTNNKNGKGKIKAQTYTNLVKLLKNTSKSKEVFNFPRKNSQSRDLSQEEGASENQVIDDILSKYEDQG